MFVTVPKRKWRYWRNLFVSALVSLARGALGFRILLAPLQELDAARPDNTSGMTLVALAFLFFLVYLWRRIRRNTDEPLRRAFNQEQASTKA